MNGIFTALLTPFNSDYSINPDSLKKLVEFNIAQGVNGFYVGGSTGEGMLMTKEERKQIFRLVKEAAGDRVDLIAHVGATCTDDAVDMALEAKALGYDAISAVAPFYYSHTLAAVKQYYYDIADAADMPMLIYNFPGSNSVNFTAELAAEMFSTNGHLIGIKHTSQDLFMVRQFKEKIEGITVFNGFDEVCLAGLSMGADGAIGSTYNFMGRRFVEIYNAFCAGDLKKAKALQDEGSDIISAMIKHGVFQCEKEILTQMGIDMGPCRRPFLPITEEGKAACRELVKKI